MKAVKLAGLEPASVMGFFEKLCSIPHGSFNNEGISNYFVSFAKERGLRYIQDKAWNVVIFKDGSKGYEDKPAVILQAHMDMVCEKDADCDIDMKTQPLDITHDGVHIWAKHTSLGADDGIGVAYCLAILDDDSIAHPPLEVVFTADEEAGMGGASKLDFSVFTAKRMINLDTEHEGFFTVGCAGCVRVYMEMPVKKTRYSGLCLQLSAEGFRGGHSGSAIIYNYGNCNKLMGKLLDAVRKEGPVQLCSLSGGAKPNSIPREARAVVAAEGLDAERLRVICSDLEKEIRETYDEPNATVTVQVVEVCDGVMSVEDTDKIINAILEAPNGLQKWNPDLEGVAQTSLNMGCMQTADSFRVVCHVRSSVNQEKYDLVTQLKDIGQKYGFHCSAEGDSPAWEYNPQSPLRETMSRIYTEMSGHPPVVKAIHAGLECGIFYQNIPNLDCVSACATALDIHTNREKLVIASAERVWKFLLEVLKQL